MTKPVTKNPWIPIARIVARGVAGVETQTAYDALPEVQRREASQRAWKIVGAIKKYNGREKGVEVQASSR